MPTPAERPTLAALQQANLHSGSRLTALLEAQDVELNIGGAGIAGDLRRIYEVRHEIVKSDGRDSDDWRQLVAVLRSRERGPKIRLVTARAGDRRVLAVLDGDSLVVLAELCLGF